MNKFEMIKWLQNLKKDIGQSQHQDLWHYAEMLDEVIAAIEVSEDCISKHDIWKIIEDNAYWVRYNENSTEKGMTLTGINQALNECPLVAPSVVPSRAEGEWLLDGRCSECLVSPLTTHKNYCPNCGAKMKGVDE